MKNKRIHYIQHVAYEGLGSIEEWAFTNGYLLSATRLYETPVFTNIPEFDWLIVLGGPMGVYDEDKFGWLKEEKQLIKQVIDADKKVLGICLGAQLIAEVLGASVYSNKEKEIGWFEVSFTKEAASTELFFDAPSKTTVFHWHGDTFNLPDGSTHLAYSDACANQAFVYKKKVVGLQFHLESTEHSLEDIYTAGAAELVSGQPYIQSAKEIYEQRGFAKQNKALLFTLLDRLASL